MNELIHESSPYLQQHAHNPVNWHAWNEAAFQKAVSADKPILLSIGYATCHWCHVMERESFEDQETADFMNAHFINIKLDREEYPELDKIYMEAVQYLHGHGGWPLNVFLLPDKRPFFGGTYYPPYRSHGRPSWLDVLNNIRDAWQHKRSLVEEQAEKIVGLVQDSEQNLFQNSIPPDLMQNYGFREDLNASYIKISAQFDRDFGGFGQAPKFPSFMVLMALMHHYYYFKDEFALTMTGKSLDAIIRGGIYDQIGGGVSRYATDPEWNIPHFEKMLYDNALFLEVLALQYQQNRNPHYLNVAMQTMNFLDRELRDESGLYYAALDADSEGVEGKFYVWSYEELESFHFPLAQHLFDYYHIEKTGNWEHSNILFVREPPESYAAGHDLDMESWLEAIRFFKETLLIARNKRERPGLDHKIILSWNALLVPACVHWARYTDDSEWINKAVTLYQELKSTFNQKDFYLYRIKTKGKLRLRGNLDDYAYMIKAAIALHQFTGVSAYLADAIKWTAIAQTEFFDEAESMFYMTTHDNEDVYTRVKELYDSSQPSSNAVMMENLWYLGWIISENSYKERALSMLTKIWGNLVRYPISFSYWLKVGMIMTQDFKSVEIFGPESESFKSTLKCHFLPGTIIKQASNLLHSNESSEKSNSDNTFAIVCSENACSQPLFDSEELLNAINLNT